MAWVIELCSRHQARGSRNRSRLATVFRTVSQRLRFPQLATTQSGRADDSPGAAASELTRQANRLGSVNIVSRLATVVLALLLTVGCRANGLDLVVVIRRIHGDRLTSVEVPHLVSPLTRIAERLEF